MDEPLFIDDTPSCDELKDFDGPPRSDKPLVEEETFM